jgi:16S rRNA (cytidine1402-2'-O)-methyltransferase
LKNRRLSPGLYLVSTPIGNLGDITIRALETLAGCDLIACEDTRTSGVLLTRYGISKPKISYNEHNADRRGAEILRLLEQEKSIALISDAGTPLVSDPGSRLVNSVVDAGFPVVPVPGASAPISALVASGLPNEQFLFAGFLPSKQGARLNRLKEFSQINATLIFFESPRRLAASLRDMVSVFGGERRGVVAREITKMHETFYRNDLSLLAEEFSSGSTPKGEIVVLIDAASVPQYSKEDIDRLLIELLKEHSISRAAARLAEKTGLPKRSLYQRALELKGDDGSK